MSTFNVDDGFLEAMARGFRGRIMTRDDYQALIQSETLEDLKMHLSSTEFDYTKELEAMTVRQNFPCERDRVLGGIRRDRGRVACEIRLGHKTCHTFERLLSPPTS